MCLGTKLRSNRVIPSQHQNPHHSVVRDAVALPLANRHICDMPCLKVLKHGRPESTWGCCQFQDENLSPGHSGNRMFNSAEDERESHVLHCIHSLDQMYHIPHQTKWIYMARKLFGWAANKYSWTILRWCHSTRYRTRSMVRSITILITSLALQLEL